MSPIKTTEKSASKKDVELIYQELEQRLSANVKTSCPVEFASVFVKLAGAQSCGKCVPCRVGLAQLSKLIDDVLDGIPSGEACCANPYATAGEAHAAVCGGGGVGGGVGGRVDGVGGGGICGVGGVTKEAAANTIKLIEELSEHIYLSADCAIGYEAASVVYRAVKAFNDDFCYHLEKRDCLANAAPTVPCSFDCPAGVDIPGYIALLAAKRYDDAIMLVRRDNPFAAVCSLICDHPCELHCRRTKVDDPINIRGLKRYAAERAHNGTKNTYPLRLFPSDSPTTGKKIAIVGGGPAGISAAFYLRLMGHEVTIFEQRMELGGMMRYGIPAYRLPRAVLASEIDYLTAHGVNIEIGVSVGADISLERLRSSFDAVYLAIGAHAASALGIPGENTPGVISAVQMLRDIGDDKFPDFTGKSVVVIGGGNVAMDVARSALRFGATKVTVVYRRRKQDMTAQAAEIDAAIAEGCELLELHAPVRIQTDGGFDGNVNESLDGGVVSGIVLQPQIITKIESNRALPMDANAEAITLACDIVLVAIGQRVDTSALERLGLETRRNFIQTLPETPLTSTPAVFAGGECVTGTSTLVHAVAAGKAAARAIDSYLGFDHKISLDIDIPPAFFKSRIHCARSNTRETIGAFLPGNFDLVECGLLDEEAEQEAQRCLRCDHFGLGSLRGGRSTSW